LVVVDANLNDAEEPEKEKATFLEVAASEAPRGNIDSPNISNIIKIGSSTTSASLYFYLNNILRHGLYPLG